jgi:hypothetical protein
MKETREVARKALEKAAAEMKKFADRKRGPLPDYQVGDKVLLDASHYPSVRPSGKLSERRYGPFTIIKKLSSHNYTLDIPPNWKIHPTFHVDQLRKYHEDPRNPNFPKPPPDLVGEHEEWEVERILDTRLFGKKKTQQYLVKWKGYTEKDNTWEPMSNLPNAKELVEEFHLAHPKVVPVPPTRRSSRKQRVRFLGVDKDIEPKWTDFQPLVNDTAVTTWPGNPFTKIGSSAPQSRS